MNWELDALRMLARNSTVPGVALTDAIGEIDRLQTQNSALVEQLKQANEALLLCEPIVQQDWYSSDTDACCFCGEEINSGDEHKDDCEGVVAYLAAHKALEPYRARVGEGG